MFARYRFKKVYYICTILICQWIIIVISYQSKMSTNNCLSMEWSKKIHGGQEVADKVNPSIHITQSVYMCCLRYSVCQLDIVIVS